MMQQAIQGAATAMMPTGASGALLYAMPVIGSMLLCYGIYQAIADSRSSDRKKLHDRLRGQTNKPEKELDTILRRGAIGDGRSFADAMLGKLSIVPKIQTMLDQADIRWSASQMLMNLGGAGLLATVGLAAVGVSMIAAVGCGAAIMVLPLGVINFLRKRRVVKLTAQLPDVFEMMGQALRAGHSLAGAIQLVADQLPPPIATEFAQVYREQNLGVKIEDALQSMAARVDSLDVKFFVTAVMIQRQTGGDLAEVLDNISDVIRQRIELQGMVKALTGEGRLSGWVLFALPIVMFLGSLKLNPGYANMLLDDPTGRTLLMVAGGLQLVGLAMIRWIVNIKI